MSEAGGHKGAGRRREAGPPAIDAGEGRALVPAGVPAGAGEGDDLPDGAGQEVIVPRRHRNDGWTPIRQRAFLRGLAECGSVTDVCARLGMSTTSAYRLRSVSVTFAEQWDKAAQNVAPILEQAAYERGVEGWDEEVYQGGKLVGYKKRYSDAALGMLIKAQQREAGPGPNASPEELEIHACAAARRAKGTFQRDVHQVSMAEVEAALNKRIAAIIRARGKGAARQSED